MKTKKKPKRELVANKTCIWCDSEDMKDIWDPDTQTMKRFCRKCKSMDLS